MPQPTQTRQTAQNGPQQDGSEAARAYANLLVDEAATLHHRLVTVQKDIADNRDSLRRMRHHLNDDQRKWLADFYPEKEKDARRSKDQIDATRKAKAAALKAVQEREQGASS